VTARSWGALRLTTVPSSATRPMSWTPSGIPGGSVITTGRARLVRDPAAVTRYEQMLKPWAAGQMDYVIAIKPQIITGIHLVAWCRCPLPR
jgi:hypothetical protein